MSLGASVDPAGLTLVQIKDTLHLETIRISATLRKDLSAPPGVTLEVPDDEAVGAATGLKFAADGTLERLP